MKQIKIEGGNLLKGEIKIGGAKNSAVALIPASILSDGIVNINNIPKISDIDALNEILVYLNAKVEIKDNTISINSSELVNKEIPENIAKKLRASYYFMSALLGKYKKVEMYFPGGCSIGARPIDQTLKGFRTLGATVIEEGNKFTIFADELIGNTVKLDMPSVGATINTLLVAVKAKGTTIIENAAREPEIVNVIDFLNAMGAKISGGGESVITIEGVDKLGDCSINVIPDRIEAGTYIIAGALVGDKLKITNINPTHLENLLSVLRTMNVNLNIGSDFVEISKTQNLNPVSVTTLGYPGFSTDLQQPLVTLLTMCSGESTLTETIYENRFQNVKYLNEMGSNISVSDDNKSIKVLGPTTLKGATVVATDLRAGACLVLAGLAANGETTVTEVEHVLRGYENIISKLTNVGAKISLEEI